VKQTSVEQLRKWHKTALAATRQKEVGSLRLTLQDLAFVLKCEIDRRTGEGLGE
jgi:hypothetical protein